MIHRAVVSEDDDVCLDLDSCSAHSMSESMIHLMLHKIVCFPVESNCGRVTGVIYADAKRSPPADSGMAARKPVLRILARMLALRLSAV